MRARSTTTTPNSELGCVRASSDRVLRRRRRGEQRGVPSEAVDTAGRRRSRAPLVSGDITSGFSELAKDMGKPAFHVLVRWPATRTVGGRRLHQRPPRRDKSRGPQGGADAREGAGTCPARARHVHHERSGHKRCSPTAPSAAWAGESSPILLVCSGERPARHAPRRSCACRSRARGACQAEARAANAGRGARGATAAARADDRRHRGGRHDGVDDRVALCDLVMSDRRLTELARSRRRALHTLISQFLN